MDKIEKLEKQLKEINQEIADFEPDSADKEVEKLFHRHVNELYSNNDDGTILICGITFIPCDLLANHINGYLEALRSFVASMSEEDFENLTAYKNLISKKEEIENDLQNAVAERGYF